MMLTPVEARVLGSLVEKELTTPENYPLTMNALVAACNQKSNRDPVVTYGEDDVAEALDSLQRQRLVASVSGAHLRVTKYRHMLATLLNLSRPEVAALSVLLLRGPQTVGEIRTRTGRMWEYADAAAVEATLDRLRARPEPLVTELSRRPGQKDARYAHLMSGEPVIDATPSRHGSGDRMAAIDEEVATLRARVDALEAAFEAFREQFE
jgi:uncharacterized protein